VADRYDLLVVGMGSGGMVAAEFATTLDLRVGVVERERVGGDCLWTGCVPSKALLASAKAAHVMRHADHYGIDPVAPSIDTARVWSRIRRIQDEIAATDDSPGRYREELGVDIHFGAARVIGPRSVTVGDGKQLEGRFILLCTGSRPFVPPVEGLVEAGFLTSETVFELERAPDSITFIGGGPIAIELAQAFTRLGVPTTVLQRGDRILARDEPMLVERLTARLRAEGVDLRLGVGLERVTVEDGMKVVHGREGGQPRSWAAHEIFVAAGRHPNVDGLGVEEIGVRVGRRGVETDDRLRTSVESIYAAGDVAGRYLFTHSAGYEAVRAVRNMFFPGSSKGPYAVPWCTFCDPELAHAGLTEAEAVSEHGADDVAVWVQDLAHSDRARTDGAEDGAIKLVTAKGKLIGAHVLAPSAGEVIHEPALAIHERMRLSDVASMIHVYPTIAIGVQQLAADVAYERAGRYKFLVRKG
jgi:pyruvate/2-oxoglutarate dehydrogenase complex dihydrolipoamide dehydrogenase (E3) component